MTEFSLWLMGLALIIAWLGLLWGALRQRQLTVRYEQLCKQLEQVRHQLEQGQQFQQQARAESDELRGGTLALGKRLVAVEQQVGQLAEQQPDPEQLEPERRLYRRAVRMVELGADVDEIMVECELPRAEAELILNLHRQKQRN